MSKYISVVTFPRTPWKESMGLRKVLARAFNTSRTSEKRLLSLQSWLRYMTTKVNKALVELETGAPLAVAPKVEVPVEVPAIVIEPVAIVAPILINVEK